MAFVADEVVTAAKLNLATSVSGASNIDDRTFTNTAFLDLSALTGGAGSMAAVAVTVLTGTSVWISVSGTLNNSVAGGLTLLGYRISGATTVAAADPTSIRIEAPGASQEFTLTVQRVVTGLTAGSNTFTLQARASANVGRIMSPALTVMTI